MPYVQNSMDAARYRVYSEIPRSSSSVDSSDRVNQLRVDLQKLTRDLKVKESEKCFEELVGLIGNRDQIWTSPLSAVESGIGSESLNRFDYSEEGVLSEDAESVSNESGLDGNLETFRLAPIVPYNMMLTMYSRLKNASRFMEILNRISEAKIAPDIYTYNALFKLRANRGELELLLKLAVDMIEENVRLDVVSYNIMIEALGEKGWAMVEPVGPFGGGSGIVCAHRVLKWMSRQKIRREPRTYEVMFNALFKVDLCEEIVELWDEMLQRGTLPTAEACSTVMKAYYRLGAPDRALKIWLHVKNILMDYIRHLEGLDSSSIRTKAVPRFQALQHSPGSWDPLLPTARTENIVLDLLEEAGQLNAFFETWHLFRRADITPLANSCAAIMELYLDIGDYRSGLNVFEWTEHVKISPSPRLFSANIALLAYASFSGHQKGNGPMGDLSERLQIRTSDLDHGTMSQIRQRWMALRALDNSYHPPQFSTIHAAIISFYSANDYIGVFDAFRVMMDALISRSPTARSAPNSSVEPISDLENRASKRENGNPLSKTDYGFQSTTTESEPSKIHHRAHTKQKTRSIRHVPPLRGHIGIETLILVLEAYSKAKSWYGADPNLLAEVELARQVLNLEPTQDYAFAKTLTALDSPVAPQPSNESNAPDSIAPWTITSVGSTELLNTVKKSKQPKFVPTSWNIAIPGHLPKKPEIL